MLKITYVTVTVTETATKGILLALNAPRRLCRPGSIPGLTGTAYSAPPHPLAS